MSAKFFENSIQFLQRIPDSLIALIGRVSIAAIFWLSAQTKIDGFALNILAGEITLGWPHLSASAIDLFRDEYRLPFVPPEIAAPMAAISEHIFAALLLIGLASRFAALALLGLTMVIQVFVYPDAYPTHGVWATVLLFIVARGPGIYSLDHLIAERYADCNR
jgi:putative oxidoreductase